MDAPALPKKLFHAVVVMGMVSVGTTACSSDSSPSPNPGGTDAGGKDGAVTDAGGGSDASNTDAFAGWAPCH
jgi:hypothetical protein